MWLGGLYTDTNANTNTDSDTNPDNDGQRMIVWALWLINQMSLKAPVDQINLPPGGKITYRSPP